ncbi:Lysophosphatidic acid:oleoyl-CoA acyltransferase 1 [Microsporum ferrugineum]
MEKYSQFRDRASGIAPFLPVVGHSPTISLLFHAFLFVVRFPLLISACIFYFCVLQWLPIGSLGNKVSLWTILGIPGIWWVDLQIEGVKRGSLAKHQHTRLPGPGTVIASSFTSPVDVLYLAAIFNPIFTASYPSTQKVKQISLLQAIARAFAPPEPTPPHASKADLTDISTLIKRYPNSCVVVFPECTTTNGKGILELSPSLCSALSSTRIFPVNLRYEPADITTPIPGSYVRFIWNLLSKPTHFIRVRIAESVQRGSAVDVPLQSLRGDSDVTLDLDQQKLLFLVGDSLARLGRVKRVGLGVRQKQEFVRMWDKTRK